VSYKYQENPLVVTAYKVVAVEGGEAVLENDARVVIKSEATIRDFPKIGDYYVTYDECSSYFLKKESFEQKFTLLG
jgi:hypothetical protein